MTTGGVQKAQALSCLGLECGAKKMGPMPRSRVSVGEQGRRAKDRGAGWGGCWGGSSGSGDSNKAVEMGVLRDWSKGH